MNRLFILVIVATLAVAVACSAFTLKHHSEASVVRIATLQGGISTLDLMAMENSSSLGFKLVVLRLQKTPDIIAAIEKGDADIAVIPAEMAAKMILDGEKIVIIAVDMMQNQAVLSLNDSLDGICSLAGKTVAAPIASGTFKMFKAYARIICNLTVSMKPGGRGSIRVVNTPPGALAEALASHSVDAIVAWEPIVSKCIVDLKAHIVDEYSSLWRKAGAKGEPVMLVWVARSDFVAKNPSLVKKVVEDRMKVAREWVSDRDIVIRMLENTYKLSPAEASTLYSRVKVYTGGLTREIIKSIRMEWWIAWKGGYLRENPSSIPDKVFYTQ